MPALQYPTKNLDLHEEWGHPPMLASFHQLSNEEVKPTKIAHLPY